MGHQNIKFVDPERARGGERVVHAGISVAFLMNHILRTDTTLILVDVWMLALKEINHPIYIYINRFKSCIYSYVYLTMRAGYGQYFIH